MVAVAGDGVKQFVIGVLTQVSKRSEVDWHETTTITTADERSKSLEIGGTCKSPPGAGRNFGGLKSGVPIQKENEMPLVTGERGGEWGANVPSSSNSGV